MAPALLMVANIQETADMTATNPEDQSEAVCDGTRGALCSHQDPNNCDRQRDCPAFVKQASLYPAATICPNCRRIPAFSDVWCPCGERMLPEKKKDGASYAPSCPDRAAHRLSNEKANALQSPCNAIDRQGDAQ